MPEFASNLRNAAPKAAKLQGDKSDKSAMNKVVHPKKDK